jgi:excisionase family DNA binding protein
MPDAPDPPPGDKPPASRKKKPSSGRTTRSRTDLSMKTVFTTGEAAKICKVSQQTIIRCFDSGQLKGFRVPGSRFRRIPREILYKFMKENGIPTDSLESGKRKALIVDDDESLVELIRDVLDADGRFDVRAVNNGFDAGITVREYKPDVMILDIMLPDINGQEVCQRVRSDSNLDATRIICISGMVEREKVADLSRHRGWVLKFSEPDKSP